MIKKLIITAITFLSMLGNAFAQDHNHRPDHHAPIGVMRDHVHKKGELMTSYRYSLMQMQGLRNNQERLSTNQVLQNYMAAAKDMQMQMHMLGFMYGITDNFTASLMGGFVVKDMEHEHRSNPDFKRESTGVSDTKLSGLYQFLNNKKHQSQLNLGLSFPTGEIDEAYNGTRLPYAMQIGSGSYELLPGLTHKIFTDICSIGFQANGVFRLDTNDNGYKLGDQYNFTSWAAKNINKNLSFSTRLNYKIFEAIEGEDATLSNTMMIATRDTSLYDGRRLDLSIGLNYLFTKGSLKANRLAVEFGKPIYQRLDGAQMEVDYTLTAGWQKTF